MYLNWIDKYAVQNKYSHATISIEEQNLFAALKIKRELLLLVWIVFVP